jgi:hypothetical protein
MMHQGNTNTNSDTASTNNGGVSVNGAGAGNSGNSDDSSAAGVGGLVTASDAKSQLFSAFTALDLPDQYDAVLTGLCAKILDNESATSSPSASGTASSNTAKALQDPMQLLQEMNQKRIVASPRSIMALIDVRVYVCRAVSQPYVACL